MKRVNADGTPANVGVAEVVSQPKLQTIPPEYGEHPYMSLLLKSSAATKNRILIGMPTTGQVRIEWAIARWGQQIPCNWSAGDFVQSLRQATPLGYDVADARNIIVREAVQKAYEWLFFLDHDVVLPPDAFIKLNRYMREATIPVVAGLYFARCHPPEPLLYRGRGNSYYGTWKMGDKVWVDGVPMGSTLIHVSLLKAMYDEAPEYVANGNQVVRRVFDTPAFTLLDPEHNSMHAFSGTEDLAWCDRVIHGEFLKKAGWPKMAKKKHPFLVDTSIFSWHIEPNGQRFPLTVEW